MASIKNRQRVIAANFISSTGLNRDLIFPWQEFFLASASVMAGSVAIATLSGCNLAVLRITATANTCPIWVTRPVPQDAAITGKASGSGTVYIDWTDPTTPAALASISASLWLVPNGSAISDAGASLIGTATCVQLLGTSASEFQSASLMNFNAPTTRAATFVLKIKRQPGDPGDTSGSDFHLFGARLRYLADRMGS